MDKKAAFKQLSSTLETLMKKLDKTEQGRFLIFFFFFVFFQLALVLLNLIMPCLCKQFSSRSVSFWTDMDLLCLSFNMWISNNNLDQVIWSANN